MMEFRSVHKNVRNEVTEEITLTIDEDGDLHDVMQAFRRFLLAVSFQPGSIANYIEAE